MTNGDKGKRSERVQLLKRLLIIFLVTGIVLPLFLCILLFIRINRLEQQLDDLRTAQQASSQVQTKDAFAGDFAAGTSPLMSEDADQDTADTAEGKEGQEPGQTMVYLTFDDGPSSNTAAILDVLQAYDVKATFFVIGKTQPQYASLYQRIVDEGHTLGMHSFSHKYDEIYASEDAFWEDLSRLQEFLYDTTEVWPRFYRFPGGSSNQVSSIDIGGLARELTQQDIYYLDWNVSGGDATNKELTPRQIADNVVRDVKKYKTAVVLLHDTNDKTATVEALPLMIEELQGSGQVQFAAANDEMQLVQHLK